MFNNTFSVLDKIKRDLLKGVIIGDITLQVLFLVLYGYSIYTNLNHLFFFIANIALAGISLFYLIFSLFSISKKGEKLSKRMKKNIKRLVSFSKYFIRFIALGITLYEMFYYGADDTTKVITLVTAIGLVLQIILEIVQAIVCGYVEMLKESAVMDYEASMVKTAADYYQKLMDAKNDKLGYVLEAVDVIPGMIADKINGVKKEPVDPYEGLDKDKVKLREKISNLTDDYVKEKENEKRIKKEQRAQEIIDRKEEHREEKINDIKSHLNTIKNKILKK